jgi:predicted nucleotidyltransferase
LKNQIKKELQRLQEKHQIQILYAVESGSRAWGFASPDSDWDVRFIYIHKPEWYLSIDTKKDNLNTILPNDIDLAGWELRKTLKLFRKSNPPLLEWLQSPIVYLEQYSTAQKLKELAIEFFNPKSCMHHYLSMAKGTYKNYLEKEEVKIKKYFYVLRPILASRWIERTSTMAPIEFNVLVDQEVKDPRLLKRIQDLTAQKTAGDELTAVEKDPILMKYIDQELEILGEKVNSIDVDSNPGTPVLDALFQSTLQEVWA